MLEIPLEQPSAKFTEWQTAIDGQRSGATTTRSSISAQLSSPTTTISTARYRLKSSSCDKIYKMYWGIRDCGPRTEDDTVKTDDFVLDWELA